MKLFRTALAAVGREARLFGRMTRPIVTGALLDPVRLRRCADEAFGAAVETLPVQLAASACTAILLVTEFSFHMKLVLQQDSLVPSFSTALLLRELGPVIAGFLLATRVGAGWAAEIATRNATEQLEALDAMGVDRNAWLLAPRLIAGAFAGATLTILGIAASAVAAAGIASMLIHRSPQEYFRYMWNLTDSVDVGIALAKGALFGFLVAYLGLRAGLRAPRGSRGAGAAATEAVVASAVMIFAADFLVTALAW